METGILSKLIDKRELKRLIAIMLPLYIANLLHMGMGVTDTLVAGWKGEQDLAAVAMGFSVVGPLLIAVGALLTILNAIISRLRGAGADSKAGIYLNNGKTLALILAGIEIIIIFAASFALQYTTDNHALVQQAQLYTWYAMLGVPANLLMRVICANFEGYGQTRPAMIVAFLGLLANIPLNYALVFGLGPFPALGGPGCGLATAIITWFTCFIMYLLAIGSRRHRERTHQTFAWRRPDWKIVRSIVKLGFPISVATLCELSFFSAVTLIMAPLGETAVSSHQVALNVSGIIFMLPLSLGIAASIRAAYHVGAKRKDAFSALLKTLLTVTYSLVLVLMLATIFFRRDIVSLYTDSQHIINTASTLLIYCAIYQIADATQAIMCGLLRGCHDTAMITWSNLTSYWVIGLPLSCILIRTDFIVPAMGPAGAWVSFIVALTIAAIILTTRFCKTRRKVFAHMESH